MAISKRRVYVDKEGKVVPEGDPTADHLVVAEGGEITAAELEKHGLTMADIQEEKQGKSAENKQQKGAENK